MLNQAAGNSVSTSTGSALFFILSKKFYMKVLRLNQQFNAGLAKTNISSLKKGLSGHISMLIEAMYHIKGR